MKKINLQSFLKNVTPLNNEGESFKANVTTMIYGTTLSQAIPILISPIISRLYSPYDFGVYAIFTSISLIAALVATGRYELAVILPERDEDAASIVSLASLLALGTSILSFIAVALLKDDIMTVLNLSGYENLVFLIPVSIFTSAVYQPMYSWATRHKLFKVLSRNMVYKTGMVVSFQLLLATAGCPINGLIIAQVAGNTLALLVLSGELIIKRSLPLTLDILRNMYKQAIKYKKFPQYSLSSDFLNVGSNQIPNILLSSFFGPFIAGQFSLSQRVLATPISFIASAVQVVFKERASRDYRETGSCRDIYVKVFRKMSLYSSLPFLLLFLTGPTLVPIIFGQEWQIAGMYIRLLSLMYFIKFFSSTLSYTLYIAEKQHIDLLWEIALFILTLLSMYIGYYNNSPSLSILFFSISYSVLYLIMLYLSYKFSVKDRN